MSSSTLPTTRRGRLTVFEMDMDTTGSDDQVVREEYWRPTASVILQSLYSAVCGPHTDNVLEIARGIQDEV